MNLVDDVYTIFSFRRWVLDLFPDLTNILNAVVGRSIDLNDVHGSTGCNIFAHGTFPTGTSVYRMLAIDCLCKNFRYACLSCPSCPAEEIGMTDTSRHDLILQRCDNMILSFYVFKFRRTEFTIQGSI